jgi:hypothetical protein
MAWAANVAPGAQAGEAAAVASQYEQALVQMEESMRQYMDALTQLDAAYRQALSEYQALTQGLQK